MTKEILLTFYIPTHLVLFVSFYLIALMCFKLLKRATYDITMNHSLLNISYTPTSNEHDEESQEEDTESV